MILLIVTNIIDDRNEKQIALDIFKTAEINLFVSLLGLKKADLLNQISPETNHIFWIFGHCATHLDQVFGRLCLGKNWFKEEYLKYFAYGVDRELAHKTPTISFQELVETYLELTGAVSKYMDELPEEKFRMKPEKQKEGERIESLIDSLVRIALHYMGHLGQITMIRRTNGNPVPMGFVAGMAKESRERIMEKWTNWWNENKKEFNR